MGFIEVAHLRYSLPGGRVLLDDASFRVGEGQKVALVGANGTGKTTLLRLIARDEEPERGSVVVGGRLGVMRQFIGSLRDQSTVRDLLLGLAPAGVRAAGRALLGAERGLDGGGDRAGVRYAAALTAWGDAGGYEAELLWDLCTTAALGRGFDEAGDRPVNTLAFPGNRPCCPLWCCGAPEPLWQPGVDAVLDAARPGGAARPRPAARRLGGHRAAGNAGRYRASPSHSARPRISHRPYPRALLQALEVRGPGRRHAGGVREGLSPFLHVPVVTREVLARSRLRRPGRLGVLAAARTAAGQADQW